MMISIIIPFKDKADFLIRCLKSILDKTSFSDFEIILVDNNSSQRETKKYLSEISQNPKIKILKYPKPFNFSAINNFAVKSARGEYLLFLNNDTEIIAENWLEKMLECFQDEKVGAVGAKLIYPDGSVQHNGIEVGESIAVNLLSENKETEEAVKNCDAVTGACLMTSKKIFNDFGGFDEINLPIAYNDVDYCLRLKEMGYKTVCTPFAKLLHFESASRKSDVGINTRLFNRKRYQNFRFEQEYMKNRWSLLNLKANIGTGLFEKIKKIKVKFPESKLAHQYLDGLSGLEIGGSAHNSFGLNTKNVDYTDSMETKYKKFEEDTCGEKMSVDIVAPGDELPVADESQDFIVNSHVLEHFHDPIKALKEWYRTIRGGGYIFMIVPHKDRTFDRTKQRTTLKELLDRHEGRLSVKDSLGHYSFWITEDLVELINYLDWKIVEAHDVDDKAGNGFTIVIQKTKEKNKKFSKIFKPSFFWKLKNRLNILIKSHLVSFERLLK